MNHSLGPPHTTERRIAYAMKLAAELHIRTGGISRYAKRPLCVMKRSGQQRLMLLRPLVMHEPSITLAGRDRPLYYPTLLLTKHNTYVRGTLHGSRVHYVTIPASELTDTELRQLTRAIRGDDGLTHPEYLQLHPSIAVSTLKDTS